MKGKINKAINRFFFVLSWWVLSIWSKRQWRVRNKTLADTNKNGVFEYSEAFLKE